jgi:hypothetical protein
MKYVYTAELGGKFEVFITVRKDLRTHKLAYYFPLYLTVANSPV